MIQIENLSKIYRTGFMMTPKVALRQINLQVNDGEIYGFIGPNGAGKSTTIKVLTGLLRVGSGSVKVMGYTPQDSRSREQLGYLPEHPFFYEYLTGYELLKFYGSLSGLRGKLLAERIAWATELLHANHDWIHRRLRTYSKGMMQRMGLAQAILAKPKLLILDEPMSGLDPMGRRDVREAIQSLNREGTTIFYSSHVLSDVESISHRVAMIVDGKIVRSGTIAEVTQSENLEYRVRIGTPFAQELALMGVHAIHPQEFVCNSPQARDLLLTVALQQQVGVEAVEAVRPSLEDVLAQEIAKEGAHG